MQSFNVGYSFLKESTGLESAALIALNPVVIMTISAAGAVAARNWPAPIVIL
jgi:hypothetical protein